MLAEEEVTGATPCDEVKYVIVGEILPQ